MRLLRPRKSDRPANCEFEDALSISGSPAGGTRRDFRRFSPLRLVSNVLFPPACTACGTAISAAGALCSKCWAELRFIERPFCDILGIPFPHDQGDGIVSPEAIANPPKFGRLRAAVLYDDQARRMVSALKYRDRLDVVGLMAGWMTRAGRDLVECCDVVVPVPLHRYRLWYRQFNQSAELARRIAADADRPYDPLSLRRIRPTPRQVGLARSKRLLNVRGAFAVAPDALTRITGKRILLVDDVFTTGATIDSAARTLKRAGAASVDVLTFARVAAFDG